MESDYTGIIDAIPDDAGTKKTPGIVAFELKYPSGELVEEQYPQSPNKSGAHRTHRKTIDFFRDQFTRWRAYTLGRNDGIEDHLTELLDNLLQVAQGMDDMGLFTTARNCLCHVDLHSRNVMVEVQPEPDSSLKITVILDWDEAVFAPKFMACEPLGWLWGYKVDDQVDEDGLLTWPYEIEGANDLPSTRESQELKEIFDANAGPEYPHLAYDGHSRLSRGLFRLPQLGLGDVSHLAAGERIIKEWKVLRESLRQS